MRPGLLTLAITRAGSGQSEAAYGLSPRALAERFQLTKRGPQLQSFFPYPKKATVSGMVALFGIRPLHPGG